MLGEILRHRREEAGLDLREVAHSLRFQYEYLKALEAEDLKKLPPDVYVKAYIRGYAKLLNIDPLPLLDDYAELGRDHSAEVQQPELAQPKRHVPLPRKAVFVLLLIVTGLVLVIVMYFTYPTPPVVVPVLPSVPAPETGTPVPDRGEPLKDLKQHVLDVTATETTWLLIETGEGTSEEVLLRPGESRKWTSESGFDLKVGNAGGIRMVLDNKDVGTPGEKGRVVRLHLP